MQHFLSIDIETTGTDESYCQILEFACVLGDFGPVPTKDLPCYRQRFWYNKIVGQPVALTMNAKLISEMPLAPNSAWEPIEMLGVSFKEWLLSVHPRADDLKMNRLRLTWVGKNFATFDMKFLKLVPKFPWFVGTRRVLDVGAIYFDPRLDENVPSTETCVSRCNRTVTYWVPHCALSDARLVVDLVRSRYDNNEGR